MLACKSVECFIHDLDKKADQLVDKCNGKCEAELDAFIKCGLEIDAQESLGLSCDVPFPPANDDVKGCGSSDGACELGIGGLAAAAAIAAAL